MNKTSFNYDDYIAAKVKRGKALTIATIVVFLAMLGVAALRDKQDDKDAVKDKIENVNTARDGIVRTMNQRGR